MIPFSATLRNGESFLGLGISDTDMMKLRGGGHVVIDLSSIGVGLWTKDDKGARTFLQPRDSKVVLIAGDSKEDVGEFLRVELP